MQTYGTRVNPTGAMGLRIFFNSDGPWSDEEIARMWMAMQEDAVDQALYRWSPDRPWNRSDETRMARVLAFDRWHRGEPARPGDGDLIKAYLHEREEALVR